MMGLTRERISPKTLSRVRAAVGEAWLLRWNQRIVPAMQALAEVQAICSWEVLEPQNLRAFASTSEQDVYFEMLLLKQSLLRAQGLSSESSLLLNKSAQAWRKLGRPSPFRLDFELGLEFWRHENVSQACECFLLAQQKSSNAVEKAFATSNLLWCLEALDLQRDSVETELENLLTLFIQAPSDLPSSHRSPKVHSSIDQPQGAPAGHALDPRNGPVGASHALNKSSPPHSGSGGEIAAGQILRPSSEHVAHVFEQWHAYHARQEFYRTGKTPEVHSPGQIRFFRQWANRLPYVANELTSTLKSETVYMWQGSYRERTLDLVWSPADKDNFRLSDAIDRIYLWVWCWLAAQERINLEKLLLTFDSIAEGLDEARLAVENRLLLRNACAWILFIEPGLSRKFKALIEKLNKTASRSYSLLQAEFFLIQALGQPQGEAARDVLKGREFEPFAGFQMIFEAYGSEQTIQRLPRLNERILELREAGRQHQLVVDLKTQEVSVLGRAPVRSASLCSLLVKLSQRSEIPVFDLEPGRDIRWVYNLVARLKTLLADKNAVILHAGVLRAGPSFPPIKVLAVSTSGTGGDSLAREDHLRASSPLIPLSAAISASGEHLAAAKILLPQGFTRMELGIQLHLSKPTACRVLQDWLERGEVLRTGRGKETRYTWRNHLKLDHPERDAEKQTAHKRIAQKQNSQNRNSQKRNSHEQSIEGLDSLNKNGVGL